MILDTSTKYLRLEIAADVADNPLEWFVSVRDEQASVKNPVTFDGTIFETATPVVIAPAPADQQERQVEYVSVTNNDTANANITIKLFDVALTRRVIKCTLQPDDNLIFNRENGWQLIQADGGLRMGIPTYTLPDNLAALAALNGTGFVTQTGAGAFAERSLVAPAAGLSIADPAGVAANPTFSLVNDLAALEALNSTGFAVRTASDTWAQRTFVAPAAGITIGNNTGVAGNPTLALANDLAALEGLSSTGIAVRTDTDAWAQRTITGSTNQITVVNGSGAAGNPILSLSTTLATPAGLVVNGLLDLSSSLAGQIQFSPTAVPSADPNILDEYTEFTFTFAIVGSTTAGVGTYTTQQASGVKIGSLVHIDIAVAWTAHTGTGNMNTTALPYTIGINATGIAIINSGVAMTANNLMQAFLLSNSIALRQSATGGGAFATIPMDTAGSIYMGCSFNVAF